MFENYIEKKVKIRIQMSEEEILTFTGTIKQVNETHLLLLDKFGKEQLLLLDNIIQCTPRRENEIPKRMGIS